MLSVLFTVFAVPCSIFAAAAETLFSDVKNGEWFADASVYCFEQGYISGTADATFAPSSNVTRGMFVTILAKMNCANLASFSSLRSFSDVPASEWYHNAVEWANKNGYASGVGYGYFSPASPISRQDLALMLYTYAKKNTVGNPCVNYANLDGYTDKTQIAGYAYEAMRWAVGNGFISGTEMTKLSPRSTATRAMISVIIRNYDKTFGHNWKELYFTARTCTSNGYKKFRCLKCGVEKTVETKAWHVWNGGTVTVKPTNYSTGMVVYTCKVCGAKQSKTIPKNKPNIQTIGGVTYVDGILIANKTYSLPWNYGSGLTAEMNSALNKMFAAAASAGYNLYVRSGYRSYSRQNTLYNNYCKRDGKAAADTYSARPGHSEHQTGLAADINSLETSWGKTPEGKWLAANCYKYGFIIRYPAGKEDKTGYQYEPWHVRYLGVETATAVYKSGLCLEEYLGITSRYAD